MHYGTSSALIIISIIILSLALVAAIVAMRTLSIPSNNTNNDVKGTLVFFIVIDSIMLLVAFYALAKLRTSNIGGWWGFILGLIIVVLVLIFGISAINKVDGLAFPWILRALVFNTVMITLVFFLLVLSVFTKPKICTGNMIKKVFHGMKKQIADCRPKEECVVQVPCPPPAPQIPCPQPIQPVANCGPQYMSTNGSVSQFIVNPYLPQ